MSAVEHDSARTIVYGSVSTRPENSCTQTRIRPCRTATLVSSSMTTACRPSSVRGLACIDARARAIFAGLQFMASYFCRARARCSSTPAASGRRYHAHEQPPPVTSRGVQPLPAAASAAGLRVRAIDIPGPPFASRTAATALWGTAMVMNQHIDRLLAFARTVHQPRGLAPRKRIHSHFHPSCFNGARGSGWWSPIPHRAQ